MAPYLQPAPLSQLSIEALQNVLFRVIRSRDSVYYEHDEDTGQVREILEENVREEVLGYVSDMLPSCLQTKLILNLVRMSELQSPQLIIQLLFSEKLQDLTLELTHAGSDFMSKIAAEEGRGARISAEDIAKTLDVFERIFSERSPSEFRYLQKFLLVDTSEDPDFQGDPINNLTNTNREGGGGRGRGAWAGLMGRVQRVAGRLALCPSLTTIVLPFASDLVLAAVSECPNLSMFQNVYRSTITDEGLLCLGGLPRLAQLVLSLNTQARVTEAALRRLLASCPGLRVLELGGAANTKSLYFQGGDAKRRNEVYRSVLRLAAADPGYQCPLSRLLIYSEAGQEVEVAPLATRAPHLHHLALFSWDQLTPPRAWPSLAPRLTRLELVAKLDTSCQLQLLAPAQQLRALQLAGWGDTAVVLDQLLATLPRLDSLYLEDVRLQLSEDGAKLATRNHGLSQLSVFHCSSRQVDLTSHLPALVPGLRQLAVSSLYLDDPSRGLPFHFHLAEAGPGPAPRQPLVELQPLAGLASLERLHLNASYPPRLAAHEFSLPQLLVREFPALRELCLDNFLGRGGSSLSYTFQRTSFNRRLQWLLHQYNRDIAVTVS